ncbi:MAG: hypothetical protein O3C40_23920 [Planctomycetota bacterium]|nr:hypothetical protein [Planctomycetota bacterium]
MATENLVKFTDRDRCLLGSLSFSPFTSRQLLTLSSTFAQPFTNDRYLRGAFADSRMQILESWDLVHSFAYSTPSPGVLQYYKLSPTGYRYFYGPSAPLRAPTGGWSASVLQFRFRRPAGTCFCAKQCAASLHRVRFADRLSGCACKTIAAFLTETITAAHHASFMFTEFSPENGCVLESAGQKLMPDCRFALEDRRGRRCFDVGND